MSPRHKHNPQRTCVACREVLSKRSLIRVVKTPQGVMVDLSGKANGRGAYLHDKKSCWQQGLQGALAKALKVEISQTDKDKLAAFAVDLPDEDLAQQHEV